MKRLDLKASGFMAPDGVLVFLDVFGLVSGTKISEDGVGDLIHVRRVDIKGGRH